MVKVAKTTTIQNITFSILPILTPLYFEAKSAARK
jgi:hypothetical protein